MLSSFNVFVQKALQLQLARARILIKVWESGISVFALSVGFSTVWNMKLKQMVY